MIDKQQKYEAKLFLLNIPPEVKLPEAAELPNFTFMRPKERLLYAAEKILRVSKTDLLRRANVKYGVHDFFSEVGMERKLTNKILTLITNEWGINKNFVKDAKPPIFNKQHKFRANPLLWKIQGSRFAHFTTITTEEAKILTIYRMLKKEHQVAISNFIQAITSISLQDVKMECVKQHRTTTEGDVPVLHPKLHKAVADGIMSENKKRKGDSCKSLPKHKK